MGQYSAYKYPAKNEKINSNSAGKVVNVDLIDKIITNSVLSRENVAISPSGNYVVPASILDYKSNVPAFSLGTTNTIASGATVYNELIRLTRWLLKIGTYSYSEYRTCSGFPFSSDSEWSSNGAALFTDDYTISQIGSISDAPLSPVPNNGGVLETHLMSVDSIRQLVLNCFNSWSTSNRPRYTNTHTYCHNSCHNNCHNDCHDNCYSDSPHSDCHSWSHSNGPGYSNAGHTHCYSS